MVVTPLRRLGSAALIGVVCGMRTFTGPAALALRGRVAGAPARLLLTAVAAGEAIGDKTPVVPARTSAPSVRGGRGPAGRGGRSAGDPLNRPGSQAVPASRSASVWFQRAGDWCRRKNRIISTDASGPGKSKRLGERVGQAGGAVTVDHPQAGTRYGNPSASVGDRQNPLVAALRWSRPGRLISRRADLGVASPGSRLGQSHKRTGMAP